MLRTLILALIVGLVLACGTAAPPTISPSTTPSPIPGASLANSPSPGFVGTSWQATAQSYAGSIGQRLMYMCPPDGVNFFIYGTDVYTSDSSVCTAAVHLGLINLESGGVVTIEIRPGQDSYVGSVRNGITSAQYGLWEASYVFVGPNGEILGANSTATATPGETSAIAAELMVAGQLTMCMPFDRIRFAERDSSGQPFGVDVEIGLALAELLALDPLVVEVAFEDLIDAIRNGQCDATIGGQFITPARLELIDMIPYRQGTQHVVVAAGNPRGIETLTDLCGRTVAVIEGTIHVEILAGLSEDCTDAGREPVTTAQYPSEADAEEALSSGDADGYIGNDFITVERPNDFERSAALPPMRNGIGHRLGLANLDAALRAGLRTMIGDGTYDAILEKYDVTQVRLTELP